MNNKKDVMRIHKFGVYSIIVLSIILGLIVGFVVSIEIYNSHKKSMVNVVARDSLESIYSGVSCYDNEKCYNSSMERLDIDLWILRNYGNVDIPDNYWFFSVDNVDYYLENRNISFEQKLYDISDIGEIINRNQTHISGYEKYVAIDRYVHQCNVGRLQ